MADKLNYPRESKLVSSGGGGVVGIDQPVRSHPSVIDGNYGSAQSAKLPAGKPDMAELVDKLSRLADQAELEYWRNRNFIDTMVPDWIKGDDGPSHPFLDISCKIRAIVVGIRQ